MGKIALVFPGQGSQYVGMGKDIYETDEIARETIDKANNSLDIDLRRIMFEGTDEELARTEVTQPAIVAHSISLLNSLKRKVDFKYDACAGLSLGEYSALVAADAIDFEEAIKVVRKRGKYMQEVVPVGKGAMAAILGMDRLSLEDALSEVSKDGKTVEVANYNSPGQIVISGEAEGVKEAVELCKLKGAKKAVMLNVSAPFHSSMLTEAGEHLKKELDNVTFNKFNVPIVANVNADYYNEDPKELLIKQVSSSVLWEDSVQKLLEDDYDTFIEIGPGKTLKGFIKKISSTNKKDVKIYNIEDTKSLNEFVEIYEKGEI